MPLSASACPSLQKAQDYVRKIRSGQSVAPGSPAMEELAAAYEATKPKKRRGRGGERCSRGEEGGRGGVDGARVGGNGSRGRGRGGRGGGRRGGHSGAAAGGGVSVDPASVQAT